MTLGQLHQMADTPAHKIPATLQVAVAPFDGVQHLAHALCHRGLLADHEFKHLTGTVIYGYLWDETREHWLVDEEAAEVVRRIFALTLAGYSLSH